MRALTVRPGAKDSLEVTDVPDPAPAAGELLVEGLAVGVCGTDREIARGEYGWAPPGRERLVLGMSPSAGCGRRRPPAASRPVTWSPGWCAARTPSRAGPAHAVSSTCAATAATPNAASRRSTVTARRRWCVEADYAVKLEPRLDRAGVLMEPATVVAKAWEQVERVGARSWFEPQRVLVTGAGPIGLLAALLGTQRGLDVHVLDRVTEGPKPTLVRDLGAAYHAKDIEHVISAVCPDIVLEATGANEAVFASLTGTAPYGVVCLTGVSPVGRRMTVDAGAINREMVLQNDAVVGSVDANLRHYRQAADALRRRPTWSWLERVITRRVPLERATEAFTPRPDDVKVVIEL
ncbi:2-deoxy-scyllo-inosamine dehydrogenase OS=Streptomyces violarus OX=67380 GN=FHS41_006071 PE=3 SV=1 [Streptomyces violarus]